MYITYHDFRNKEEIMDCVDTHVPRVGEYVSIHPNKAEWKVMKVVYTYEDSGNVKYSNQIKAIDIYVMTNDLGY